MASPRAFESNSTARVVRRSLERGEVGPEESTEEAVRREWMPVSGEGGRGAAGVRGAALASARARPIQAQTSRGSEGRMESTELLRWLRERPVSARDFISRDISARR